MGAGDGGYAVVNVRGIRFSKKNGNEWGAESRDCENRDSVGTIHELVGAKQPGRCDFQKNKHLYRLLRPYIQFATHRWDEKVYDFGFTIYEFEPQRAFGGSRE